jgi:hypothetical protein
LDGGSGISFVLTHNRPELSSVCFISLGYTNAFLVKGKSLKLALRGSTSPNKLTFSMLAWGPLAPGASKCTWDNLARQYHCVPDRFPFPLTLLSFPNFHVPLGFLRYTGQPEDSFMERGDECAPSTRDGLAKSLEVMPFIMPFGLYIMPPQMF